MSSVDRAMSQRFRSGPFSTDLSVIGAMPVEGRRSLARGGDGVGVVQPGRTGVGAVQLGVGGEVVITSTMLTLSAMARSRTVSTKMSIVSRVLCAASARLMRCEPFFAFALMRKPFLWALLVRVLLVVLHK